MHRYRARDRPYLGDTNATPLTTLEKAILNSICDAYLQGIKDHNIRREIIRAIAIPEKLLHSVYLTSQGATHEVVVSPLEAVVTRFGRPFAIFCDRGTHFENKYVRAWANKNGVALEFSAPGAHNSTGMVELSNKFVGDGAPERRPHRYMG